MKIVLWGINYAPESIGIGPFNRDLCSYLVGRGHEVSAVTSFAYYPHWRKEPADQGRWHRVDSLDGVTVHRCGCYVPAVATTWRRILHELSFGLVSTFWILTAPRADVYLVVSPPLALGLFAWMTAVLKRRRFVFHVQDLQPDAAVGLGMVHHGGFVRALYGLEHLAYRKATIVSGISGGIVAAFRRKGVPEAKCVLLPNWLHGGLRRPLSAASRAAARERLGAGDHTLLAVYSGNLGRKQGLEILVEAAGRLAELPRTGATAVKLVIAGDGAGREGLEQRLRVRPWADVQLLPVLSDNDYVNLLGAADVALITQAAGTGQFFLPSKLLSVLAAGLPVVAVADDDSELSRAIRAGGFGCVVAPNDAAGLATVLRRLSESPGQRAAWMARTGWVRQYSRESVLPRFEQMLRSVALRPRWAASREPKVA